MPSERLAKLEAASEQQTKMLTEVHQHVVGKPGTEGLTTRVARVEQRQGLHSKISWTGFVAMLGLIAAYFKSKL